MSLECRPSSIGGGKVLLRPLRRFGFDGYCECNSKYAARRRTSETPVDACKFIDRSPALAPIFVGLRISPIQCPRQRKLRTCAFR